jgi:hypothetical protein
VLYRLNWKPHHRRSCLARVNSHVVLLCVQRNDEVPGGTGEVSCPDCGGNGSRLVFCSDCNGQGKIGDQPCRSLRYDRASGSGLCQACTLPTMQRIENLQLWFGSFANKEMASLMRWYRMTLVTLCGDSVASNNID